MISLVTTDVGDTLGIFTTPRVKQVLFDLSGIPAVHGKAHIVGEEERRFLHTTPDLTDTVIDGLCGALLIDRRDWPDPWPRSSFTPYPYTNPVLSELHRFAPIVALSNVSILGAPRMADLNRYCGQYIDTILTSYSTGRRKPDPRLWTDIAEGYGVPVTEVVHIGDRWVNDICGAYRSGARAIYLTTTREHHNPIPPQDQMSDRVAIVGDLRDVPRVITAWCFKDYMATVETPWQDTP